MGPRQAFKSITSDPKFVTQFQQSRADLELLLAVADERISAPEQQALVNDIRQLVGQYEVAFKDMGVARDLWVKTQREVLDTEGPKMESNLLQVMQTTKADDNVEAAATAGVALSTVMQLRLAANKFLQNPNADSLQGTLTVGDKLESELEGLKATLVMVAAVCVVALVLGVLVAVLQSRSIVLPIRMGILGAVSTGGLRQRDRWCRRAYSRHCRANQSACLERHH
ncbi:hypothetical protein [Bremerella cremea]|uniref:hypothetical protein n=1 Tax=Bremerella cremea TaxID=1031537 RepID=UPI0031EB8E00